MAINFPDAPNTNDTHTVSGVTWTYDGTKWTVNPANGGGATVTTSDSAPGSASDGDLWYDTTTAALYVYYEDGTSNQWVSSYGPAGFSVAIDDLTDVTITSASAGEVLRYNGSAWVDAQLAYSDLSGTPTLGTAAATASTDYATAAQGALADSALQSVAINDVTDVTITSAATGEVLRYNGSAWVDAQLAYSDLSGTPTIPTNNNQLTNGAGYITGYTVTEGDVTTHQAALSITESQISDLGSYLTSVAINDLTDVTITAAATGEVLRYNGSAWVDAQLAYSDLSGLPTLGTAAATASTDYATAAQGALADSALQSVALNDVTDVTISSAASGEVLRYNGSAWVDAQLSYNDLSDQPSIPPTAPVDSVNTQTGAVVLDTDDVNEGTTNLYSQWDNATGGINYAGGNVGIGTNLPGEKLHVNGNAQIGATTGNAFIELGKGATEDRFAYLDLIGDTTYTDYGFRVLRENVGPNSTSTLRHRGTGILSLVTEDAGDISFVTSNTEAMRIDASGSVGIGTDSPSQLFHVHQSTAAQFATFRLSNADGTALNIAAYPTAHVELSATRATDDIFLSTGGSETMRITSGSRVGIGTAAPATTLDVNGAYSGNITAASSGAIDCSLGNFFTETVAGAVTFSFTNVPASRSYSVTLEITYTSGSITWPASVYWPLDTAPTLNTGKTQIIVLFTSDGGTTWRGNALADFTN